MRHQNKVDSECNTYLGYMIIRCYPKMEDPCFNLQYQCNMNLTQEFLSDDLTQICVQGYSLTDNCNGQISKVSTGIYTGHILKVPHGYFASLLTIVGRTLLTIPCNDIFIYTCTDSIITIQGL